jgi:hypothetical protein
MWCDGLLIRSAVWLCVGLLGCWAVDGGCGCVVWLVFFGVVEVGGGCCNSMSSVVLCYVQQRLLEGSAVVLICTSLLPLQHTRDDTVLYI